MGYKEYIGLVLLLIVGIVLVAYYTTKDSTSTSSSTITIESTLPSVKKGSFTTNDLGQTSALDISSLISHMNAYQSTDGAWRANVVLRITIYTDISTPFTGEFTTCAFADADDPGQIFAPLGASGIYITSDNFADEFNDTTHRSASWTVNISGCSIVNYTGASPPFVYPLPTSLFLFWFGAIASTTYSEMLVSIDPRPQTAKFLV
jgi:hypothetical protein